MAVVLHLVPVVAVAGGVLGADDLELREKKRHITSVVLFVHLELYHISTVTEPFREYGSRRTVRGGSGESCGLW